jgi:DNA ligase 1
MQLAELATASGRVAETRSRLQKRALLSECLRAARPDEIAVVVRYLIGELPQGRIGLGPAIIRSAADAAPAEAATLSVRDVDAAFERIAAARGKGSQAARRELLTGLLGNATPSERDFLFRLIVGELRQGALEGVLVEAIADAAAVPIGDVRRAVMLAGEPASVAEAVLKDGRAGLAWFRLTPLSPIQPMLAQPARDADEALAALGEAVFEYKLDGARVQIHRVGAEIRIFSRRLNDVTDRLPEIVAVVADCPSDRLILDGEVVALRPNGRPLPFQVTMSRFGRRSEVDAMRNQLPLTLFTFDLLHEGGEDLIDRPLTERFERLSAAVSAPLRVPRIVTAEREAVAGFLEQALDAGHEGLMAKSLSSPYAAGRRGADWLKIKLANTLDLVVLAAEWGSGRRRGWLSNLHLGAREPDTGRVVMLGKTFKGLTDEMLAWQTQRLLELEVAREGAIVHVRPELVVEIAVNEVQTSSHYPAGMALRFARVKAFRPDKSPAEADTVDTVREIHRRTGMI